MRVPRVLAQQFGQLFDLGTKVAHLLDLSTRTVHSKDPAATAKRAREALKLMKGKEAEEELMACLRPGAGGGRMKLALECLEGKEPKELQRRLIEAALGSDQDLCRIAAEEIKRRYQKTPEAVLNALTNPESPWGRTRAAADVAGVVGDDAGLEAIAQALITRGDARPPVACPTWPT